MKLTIKKSRPQDRVTDRRQLWRLKLAMLRQKNATHFTESLQNARFVS